MKGPLVVGLVIVPLVLLGAPSIFEVAAGPIPSWWG